MIISLQQNPKEWTLVLLTRITNEVCACSCSQQPGMHSEGFVSALQSMKRCEIYCSVCWTRCFITFENGVTEERFLCKIGIRELYQKGTFLSSKSIGIKHLTFYQRQRHVNTCWQKTVIWWLSQWGAYIFCNVLNESCRFQNVSLLATPLIMQVEQRLLALPHCYGKGKSCRRSTPDFQALLTLKSPVKIKLHYRGPNLTALCGCLGAQRRASRLPATSEVVFSLHVPSQPIPVLAVSQERAGGPQSTTHQPRNGCRLPSDRISSRAESFGTVTQPGLPQRVQPSQPLGLSRQRFSSA